MKKFNIILCLLLTMMSLSACNKQVDKEESTTSEYQSLDEVVDVSAEYMHYQAPSASIIDGNIPEDTLWGKTKRFKL